MSSPRTDGSNHPTSLPDEGARDPNQTRSRAPPDEERSAVALTSTMRSASATRLRPASSSAFALLDVPVFREKDLAVPRGKEESSSRIIPMASTLATIAMTAETDRRSIRITIDTPD